MEQHEIDAPIDIVILREIKIQEAIVNKEHTIIVTNEQQIDRDTALELLEIAEYIIYNFKT